jgi:hypothetical protein
VDAYQLITSAYSQVAGIATVQGIGSALLGLALAAWMLHELYRFLVAGQADFVTPILKVGGALLVLNAIVPLGDALSSGMRSLTDAVFDKNMAELASKAWTAAFEGVQDPGITDYLEAFFSPVFWVMVLTELQLMAVVVIKVCVIDVLWPVMFAIVLFTGVLAVPIGLFPGVNTARGWAMNLVEIAIWPLVFQMVTTLLLACFSGQLARMEELRGVWEQVDELEARADALDRMGAFDEADKLQSQADQAQGLDGKLGTLFKFWAINTAFMFLCLYTPALSRKIVRSESAGYIGGAMVAVGSGAVRGAIGYAARHIVSGSRSRGGGGGEGRSAQGPPTADKPQEQRLDERKAG